MTSDTTGQAPPAPSLLPIPPDFPVAWERPGDELLLWEREAMHMALQATAMDAFFQRQALAGAGRAFAGYDLPIRMRLATFHGWAYQSVSPVSHDPAELARLGATAEQKLGALVGHVMERWTQDWLPRVSAAVAEVDGLDVDDGTDAELADRLDLTVARFADIWEVHFQLVVPMLLGVSLFDDMYREVLGGEVFEPFRLLQGLQSMSVTCDLRIAELARAARASDEVRDVLEQRLGADATRTALASAPAGRGFLERLDAFLAEFGRRADAFTYVSLPSWREDPSLVLGTIADHLAQGDRDLAGEHRALAEERERNLAAVRVRLASFPPDVQGRFEGLLQAATEGCILQEDHNFWLDCRSIDATRRVVLGVGRRLTANGVLDAADDVFHLEPAEAAGALRGGDPVRVRALVAERREDLARFADGPCPPVLGALPPGPPPDDPIARTIMKMFGGPPREAEAPDEVAGRAGSPGKVRGTARVIRSLADAHRLAHGEVLVAAMTSPPWTPLFGIAAAVVTDTGGILSHCAVVAREYGIPAVVGTKVATASIRDGQTVEVDGDEGVVRILPDA